MNTLVWRQKHIGLTQDRLTLKTYTQIHTHGWNRHSSLHIWQKLSQICRISQWKVIYIQQLICNPESQWFIVKKNHPNILISFAYLACRSNWLRTSSSCSCYDLTKVDFLGSFFQFSCHLINRTSSEKNKRVVKLPTCGIHFVQPKTEIFWKQQNNDLVELLSQMCSNFSIFSEFHACR